MEGGDLSLMFAFLCFSFASAAVKGLLLLHDVATLLLCINHIHAIFYCSPWVAVVLFAFSNGVLNVIFCFLFSQHRFMYTMCVMHQVFCDDRFSFSFFFF